MKRWIYTILLVFVGVSAVYAAGEPSGNGTSGSPYLIGTAEELKWFADQVASGNGKICGKLTADIDFTEYNTTMIGASGKPFQGTFDGNYHQIRVDYGNMSGDNTALFYSVQGNVSISNLIVSGNFDTNKRLGGFVGDISKDSGTNITFTNCMLEVPEGCVFKTSATTQAGGFIARAQSGNTCTFTNCGVSIWEFVAEGAGSSDPIQKVGGFVGECGATATYSSSFAYIKALTTNAKTSYNLSNNYKAGNSNNVTYIVSGSTSTNKGTTATSESNFKSKVIVTSPWQSGDPCPTLTKTLTWKGFTSSDWFESSNWVDGIRPTETSKVVVETGQNVRYYPEMSGDITLRAIEVKSGAQLTVSGGVLTVNGTLTNAGTVVVGDQATVDIKDNLKNTGTFTVNYSYEHSPNMLIKRVCASNITVNRGLCGRALYYTGSATKEGTIEASNAAYPGFQGSGYMAKFNGEESKWERVATPKFDDINGAYTIGLTTSGTSGYGYRQVGTLVSAPSNNAAVKPEGIVTLGDGWRWLNNPYPYSVSLSKEDILACTGSEVFNSKVQPTLWIATNNNATQYSYTTYNINDDVLVNGDGVLAPFQAVCYYFNTDATLTLPYKPSISSHPALKNEQLESDVLRLKVFSNGSERADDEVAMVFREHGSMQTDVRGLDSDLYGRYSAASQLVLQKPDGARDLAIAVYPEVSMMNGIELPFSVLPKSADARLRISAVNAAGFDPSVSVMLLDRISGEETDLRELDFELSGDGMSDRDRFAIVLREIENQGVITSVAEQRGNVRIWSQGTRICVEGGESVQVYDMQGRLLKSAKEYGSATQIKVRACQMYLVRVGSEARLIKL